jgi:1,2-diacylglycerol 3-alpha-glucosyltransferase
MNVGIFADCYRPTTSGVVTSILQLKDGLERKGHKAIIVTVDTPGCSEEDSTVYRFPSIPFNSASGFRLGLVNQRAVNRIVREEKLDILHTHTEFSLGWAAKRAARTIGLPLVHTAHTMYEEYRHYLFFGQLISPKMIQKYLQLFLSDYNAVVCPSQKARDRLGSSVPHVRTVVVGNGICKTRFYPSPMTKEDKAQARKALGIQSSDKVIIYVGRIAKEKRVLRLLDVLTPLLRKHPHYRALFVGCGPSYKHMIKATARKGVCQQAIFAGSVRWEQIYRLYSIADVFVTASLSEVHPMTLIEASMCGLPIVARRDDGSVDLVKGDYNGYLVDSDRQLAERLSELLSDEAKLLEFSRNGLILSERFNAEAHVEKLESLYQQMIENLSTWEH